MITTKRILILFFVLLLADASLAQGAVKFQGISKSLITKSKENFPSLSTKNPDFERIDALLRYLMANGVFETVEARIEGRPQNQTLIIIGRRARRISRIQISGNKRISDVEIQNTFDVTPNEPFDRKRVLESAKKLKQKYADIGNLNAVIEVEFPRTQDNLVEIHILINEGPTCTIENIQFITPNGALALQLRKAVKSNRGELLTSELLSKVQSTVSEYFKEDRYLNTTIKSPDIKFNADRSRAEISYQVVDPYRIEFLFKGNNKVEFADEALIAAIDPDQSSLLGINLKTEASNRVKEFYLKRGYAYVKVNLQTRQIPEAFRREYRFDIEEGTKVRIGKYYVFGQISKPANYYTDFIEEHSSALIKDGLYNANDFERGYKNLITELRNQGYFRARIHSTNILPSKSKKVVDIQITLYEGPLTKVQAIRFSPVNREGLRQQNLILSFTKQDLINVVNLQKDSPLKLNRLEESLTKLREFYHSHGYLEMDILGSTDSLVHYNKPNTRATIAFRIYEGPQIRVASIIIDGNEKTRNSVIRSELDFAINDILTPEGIENSISRLQRLGLFSRIDIDTLEKQTSTGLRTVIVRVNERNPGLFKFGGGVTDERNITVRLYSGVSYRNIRGTARAVTSRLEFKKSVAGGDFLENEVILGYLEPSVFKSKTDGRINITRSQKIFAQTFEGKLLKKTDVLEKTGISFLVERDLAKKVKLIYEVYGLSKERTFEVAGEKSLPRQIATTGPTLDIDYRNDVFNPTKGSFYRFNVGYSDHALGSTKDVNFIKMTSKFSYFLPVSKGGVIWANSISLGYLNNLTDTRGLADPTGKGVPAPQTFFLGGRSTIRGFNSERERIPRVKELGFSDITTYEVLGNSTFHLFKSELRVPIWGVFGGVLFYDGGAVYVQGCDKDKCKDPYRDAAGFGVRFITPVGPVNFELAYKLDRKISPAYDPELIESKWEFHFSIGSF